MLFQWSLDVIIPTMKHCKFVCNFFILGESSRYLFNCNNMNSEQAKTAVEGAFEWLSQEIDEPGSDLLKKNEKALQECLFDWRNRS
jgi:hypothetical protein